MSLNTVTGLPVLLCELARRKVALGGKALMGTIPDISLAHGALAAASLNARWDFRALNCWYCVTALLMSAWLACAIVHDIVCKLVVGGTILPPYVLSSWALTGSVLT